jgi:energy-converting hydrogenase Eha subunit F
MFNTNIDIGQKFTNPLSDYIKPDKAARRIMVDIENPNDVKNQYFQFLNNLNKIKTMEF